MRRAWHLVVEVFLALAVFAIASGARASMPREPAPRTAGAPSPIFNAPQVLPPPPIVLPLPLPPGLEEPPLAPSRATRPDRTQPRPVTAGPSPKPNPTESWVLEQIAAGKAADFKGRADAKLSSSFVRGLLSDESASAPPRPAGVHLANVTIDGDLDLSGLDVATRLTLEDVTLAGALTARDSAFHGSLKLIHVVVAGPFDLSGAFIDGPLELQDSRFAKDLILSGAKVSGPVFLDRARVRGNLDLSQASFGGGVQAFDSFLSIACEDEGPAQCDREVLERYPHAPHDPSPNDSKHYVRLYAMDVGGQLILDRAMVGADVDARHVRVARDLSLAHTFFFEMADFAASTVAEYFILEAPVFRGGVRLTQVQYGAISNGDQDFNAPSTWSTLRPIYAQCSFSADLYARLEDFFQTRGDSDIADEVYIEQKHRERESRLKGVDKLLSVLEDLLMGYGRHPSRAFGWSAIFVALGSFVFRREIMTEAEGKTSSAKYNPIWYSLDVFLPLTRLHAADEWVPVKSRIGPWIYLRIHHLLGWVLMTVGIAAITGLIK